MKVASGYAVAVFQVCNAKGEILKKPESVLYYTSIEKYQRIDGKWVTTVAFEANSSFLKKQGEVQDWSVLKGRGVNNPYKWVDKFSE